MLQNNRQTFSVFFSQSLKESKYFTVHAVLYYRVVWSRVFGRSHFGSYIRVNIIRLVPDPFPGFFSGRVGSGLTHSDSKPLTFKHCINFT